MTVSYLMLDGHSTKHLMLVIGSNEHEWLGSWSGRVSSYPKVLYRSSKKCPDVLVCLINLSISHANN